MSKKKCYVITAWKLNLKKDRFVVSGQKELKEKIEDLKKQDYFKLEILDVFNSSIRRMNLKHGGE